MNAKSLLGGWGAMFLLVAGVLVLPGLCADATSSTDPGRSAQDLVQTALRAEVSGDMKARNSALSLALSKDPNDSAARWHSGYVYMGGAWLSIEEVQRRTAADPRLAEYRRLRDGQAGTPAGELALARWCKENRLFDQARFHWKRVLLWQPQNLEAMKSLGVQWYQGRLLTPEEIKQAQADRAQLAKDRAQYRTESRRWQKHWELQVVQWRQAAKRGDSGLGESIRSELDTIDFSKPVLASAAINTLHAVVLERSATDKEQEPFRPLGLELVKALDAIMEPAATHSMIVYSVDHPIAEVRAAAADALKKRPKEMYVPWLLARMESPIESSFAIVELPSGRVICEHSLFQEGAEADFAYVRFSSPLRSWISPDLASVARMPKGTTGLDRSPVAQQPETWFRKSIQGDARTPTPVQIAVARAGATESRVEEVNAVVADCNERVHEALRRATGANVGASPRGWYDWWNDDYHKRYELETPTRSPGEKPVYVVVERITCSCFPRGTEVATVTGPRPIEEIKIGELVLAQHVGTGELAFKPVLAVTTRKPSERMKIGLGSDTLVATRGHPFWVRGEGWKMAKELKVGQRLHTVSGAVTVNALEELAPAKPWETADTFSYNLIVDDFHTYFVGDQKILVHDNVLFVFDGPTGPLPGLARR